MFDFSLLGSVEGLAWLDDLLTFHRYQGGGGTRNCELNVMPSLPMGGFFYRHFELADKHVRLKVSYLSEYFIAFGIKHDYRGFCRHVESHELLRIRAGFILDGDEMLMHAFLDAFGG